MGTLDLLVDDYGIRESLFKICGVDQLEKLEEPPDPVLPSVIE